MAAWESGYVAEMDTTALGWAVQRTGAGREKAGEPVDPHAGILFHARRGARVERGDRLATVFATRSELLAEPVDLIRKAVTIAALPPKPANLIREVFTRESAEAFLRARSGA